MSPYRNDIDLMKGMAIIAVVLYHVGILPFGYLGVEVFLAISGYLLIPRLVTSLSSAEFHYFNWVFRHLYRIWPITLCASAISLFIGYWVMIPDSYENLAQSAIASNVFANNILAAITTKNYWDSVNEYKPLMQMWYLGIMAQFYVLIPILIGVIFFFLKSIFKIKKHIPQVAIALIGITSLVIYLLPLNTYAIKFYFIQYRIWEFLAGGFVGLIVMKKNFRLPTAFSYIALLLIVVIFSLDFKCIDEINHITIIGMKAAKVSDLSKTLWTIAVVILTCIALLSTINVPSKLLIKLGKMSLSIFVWHQVLLAFIRYSLVENFDWVSLCVYIVVVLTISYISHKFIERISLKNIYSKIIFYILLVSVTAFAFYIYLHGGIVRDVPELGISENNSSYFKNTEYTDQVYSLDKDFTTNKPHVLVVGNSFARDFASILKEYDIDNRLELSYSFSGNVSARRAADTDYLFIFGKKSDIPSKLDSLLNPKCDIYGIGTKTFGKDFGIIYAKRFSPDYFNISIPYNQICDSINKAWSQSYEPGHFIDLMQIAALPNGNIPIFTPDHKVISFDYRHLTRDGCIFYSKKIDFDKIFNLNN